MPVFVFRLWGVLLFTVSATLAWIAGSNPRKLLLAHRVLSIDGIGVASAAIWLACYASTLSTVWLVAIVAACLGGIGYCLHCWSAANQARDTPRAARPIQAKTAIVIGVVIMLAAAATTAVIDHYRLHPFDEPVWAEDFLMLAKLPTVALRPSTSKDTSINSSNARTVARGISLSSLLSYAYSMPRAGFKWSGHRVLLASGVADGKFDFILASPDRERKALQEKIKKQLGLVAHRELREVDALVLVVPNSNALELPATNGDYSLDNRSPGRFTFANQPIGDLSDALEDALGKPVIDGTELTQKYSGSLKWTHQSEPAAALREIQSALSAQIGLALVSNREPVEMLVVEKTP